MEYLSASLLCDFYKISHRKQYPEGTELVYSTWTARGSRIPYISEVVAFGFQGVIQEFLIDFFNDSFFNRPKDEVISEYVRVIRNCLGDNNPDTHHLEELHDLGYLPIKICAVDEGTFVPLRVPMLTIHNTDPRFFWVTNYLETLISCEIWKMCTSATIAAWYYKNLSSYAIFTAGSDDFVKFQGHDFSMRGMSGVHDSAASGAGHLTSFVGTDTIPAIQYVEKFYDSDIESELIGCSVSATEHSVMMAGGHESSQEIETFRRLITEVHPSGTLSIVSDTWDLWGVLDVIIPKLKEEILDRCKTDYDRIVIRPDSGDPVKIICGDSEAEDWRARKGVVEILWDIFGGTESIGGYKILHQCIGVIYGDAITPERCIEICKRLEEKGFASINVVFGIGSYTYQHKTRDTFEFALKSTLCVVDCEEIQIFKSPATDSGIKKSQRGAVATVFRNDENCYTLMDGLTLNHNTPGDILSPIFENGVLLKRHKFSEIRDRIRSKQTNKIG